MDRVFNFSAGPAALPTPVLERAQSEMLDYQGTGMSVMEMSHRSKAFIEIAEQAQADLIELLVVPDDYQVLFLQGGATTQFAMVPLNLLGDKTTADYVNTGSWSAKAIKEATRFCEVNVVASSQESNFNHVPDPSTWQLNEDAAYLHICSNETIGGVQFHEFPVTASQPLVADMSSDILSRPIDISSCGIIYAGAQKNIGPAGLTVVIVRKDLLGNVRPGTPSMLDFIRLPRFDPSDSRHRKLAAAGERAHRTVRDGKDLAPTQREIDSLAAQLWGLTPDQVSFEQ